MNVGRWPLTVGRAVLRESDPPAITDAPPRHRPTVNGQRIIRIAMFTALAILAPVAVNACPVCFGDPNSPMSKGTSNGVLFLLGIVGFVQLGFLALFFSFWRRARALKKFKEQFHVVR